MSTRRGKKKQDQWETALVFPAGEMATGRGAGLVCKREHCVGWWELGGRGLFQPTEAPVSGRAQGRQAAFAEWCEGVLGRRNC